MNPATDSEFARRVAECAFRALVQRGDIDPRGKSPSEILRELSDYIDTHEIEWIPIIDHQEDLAKVADSLATNGDREEAVVLYATWIEHALNEVIHVAAMRSDLTVPQRDSLFRDTQIRAKFVWAHLLFGESVPVEEFNRVALIHSVRNDFVHYKWNPKEERDDARVAGAIDAVRLVRRYLQDFAHRHLYREFDPASLYVTSGKEPNKAPEP